MWLEGHEKYIGELGLKRAEITYDKDNCALFAVPASDQSEAGSYVIKNPARYTYIDDDASITFDVYQGGSAGRINQYHRGAYEYYHPDLGTGSIKNVADGQVDFLIEPVDFEPAIVTGVASNDRSAWLVGENGTRIAETTFTADLPDGSSDMIKINEATLSLCGISARPTPAATLAPNA